jgi:DNA modification methylase
LGEKGVWDLGELEAEFKELIIADAPIEISGFGSDKIDQVVIGRNKDGCKAGDLAPLPGASAIARVNDLFLLGRHFLICGDATDPAVVRRLMRTGVARVVLTDEPFNGAIGGHVTGGDHRKFEMASGAMTDSQFLDFNQKWMDAVLPHLVDGGILGTFIDWRGLPIVHTAATGLGLTLLDLVVWAKSNAGTGSLYQSQHELLPLFKKGAAANVNNISLGKRGRHRTNLWTYPDASSLGSGKPKGLLDHRSEKPTAMLEGALFDLTNRGDIVLDPFLSSGRPLSPLRIRDGCATASSSIHSTSMSSSDAMRRRPALLDSGETFEKVAARRRNDESDEHD